MPRPGTPVIHPGLDAAVRAVAEGAQRSTCRLLQPSTALCPLNPATGKHSQAAPTVLWTGHCRVQRQSRSAADTRDAAGETLLVASYQVTVPMSAPLAEPGMVVELLTSTDPHVPAGTRLVVHEAAVGDNQAERNLACELA